jgi:putative transposase
MIETLKKLMKEVDEPKMFVRYQVVYLFLLNYVVAEILLITGASQSNAYQWIHDFKERGLEALDYKGYPGAASKLTFWQKYYLKKVIVDKRPVDMGYPAKYNWTVRIIVDFVSKKFNVQYTRPGMSLLLHDIGLSYTKATYRLAAADGEKQAIFVNATLPGLKKNWTMAQ